MCLNSSLIFNRNIKSGSQLVVPMRGHGRPFVIPVSGVVNAKCGKCLECKKEYQDSWKIRLIEESKDWKYMCFFALTYSDENLHKKQETELLIRSKYGISNPYFEMLPEGPVYYLPDSQKLSSKYNGKYVPIASVNAEDVQQWIHRFRNLYASRYNERLKISYFACTEYGPTTLRPHAHFMAFFDNPYWIDDAISNWKDMYGNVEYQMYDPKNPQIFIHHFENGVDCGPAKYIEIDNTICGKMTNYIAKYCSKFDEFENPLVEPYGLNKCSRMMSKGIGKGFRSRSSIPGDIETLKQCFQPGSDTFFEHLLNDVLRYKYYNEDGKLFSYRLPRYFRDMFLTVPMIVTRFKSQTRKFINYLKSIPQNIIYETRFLGKTKISEKRNKPTLLSSQIATYLSNRSIERLCDVESTFKETEMASYARFRLCSDSAAISRRSQKLYNQYNKFYACSCC